MLEVIVHHPKTAGLETGVRAQLDPGSDISVLPESAAHAIGLQRDGELEAEGYDFCKPSLTTYGKRGMLADESGSPVWVPSRCWEVQPRGVVCLFVGRLCIPASSIRASFSGRSDTA